MTEAIEETRLCSCCHQTLVEVPFHKFLLYVCDDWRCGLYRERQGFSQRDPQPELSRPLKTAQLPGYGTQLAKRRENYRIARSLGLSSKEAMGIRTNKRLNKLLGTQGRHHVEVYAEEMVSPLTTPS